MNVIQTEISDVLLIEPRVFVDSRGAFYESFNQQVFRDKTKVDIDFVQDNHSRSSQNVLRGLHYQIQQAQGKLVQVVFGSIFDVAVDLRKRSSTFGQWMGWELNADSRHQLWIPPGFAHGFLVMSEVAEVIYKVTDYYAPQYERSIRWDDPDLGIAWPLNTTPILSAKDEVGQSFRSAEVYS